MDMTDIITNPIIIGLVGALITYMYLRWRNEKKQKNKNKNKNKKENINLMIPFAVFVVCWFISYAYFSSTDDSDSSKTETLNKIDIKIRPSVKTTELQLSTSDPQEFELVSKTNGVYIPNELPDIFHEMG